MKKGIIYLVIIAVIGVVAFVPGIRNFLKDTFFPVATIENAVHISEEDYDIELKGINAPSTNLKNFKDKGIFLVPAMQKRMAIYSETVRYPKRSCRFCIDCNE